MAPKVLKVILIWGAIGFILSFITSLALVAVLGATTGILISLPLILLFLGITAYKGVVSLKGVTEVEKANYGTIIGILITLAAGLFSFLANYLFFSNKASGNSFFVVVAGAIGGYLAERKLRVSKGVVNNADSKSHWLKVALVAIGIFIALLVILVIVGSLASKK